MTQQIEQLQQVLTNLGPRDREFAADLIGYYKKYHKLSPKQAPWVEKLIARSSQVKAEPTKIDVGGFDGVVALFNKAKEHLKYPKIVLSCAGKTIILSVAGKMSKAPGTINVVGEGKYPERAWFGRVSPKGEWTPSQSLTPEMQKALQELLVKFGSEPARVAKQYGKLTGNCCFCASPLTDKRSTAAGFGPVCADHYGLTTEWKESVKKLESGEPKLPLEMQQEMAAESQDFTQAEKAVIEKELEILAFTPEVVTEVQPTTFCFLCEAETGVVIKNGYPVCASCANELEM